MFWILNVITLLVFQIVSLVVNSMVDSVLGIGYSGFGYFESGTALHVITSGEQVGLKLWESL